MRKQKRVQVEILALNLHILHVSSNVQLNPKQAHIVVDF